MRWNNFRARRSSARPLEQFSTLAALQRSRWNSFRARRTPARLLNKISANDTEFCFISYFCNEIH